MTAQAGRTLLLKIGDGASPTETFTTIAGLKAKQFQLNAETIDATNADSAGQWRELLAAAGVRSATLSGNGIFRDQTSDERLRSVFFSGTNANWQIVVPDFGTLQGAFQVSALEYGGAHDGAVTFTITLQSAGSISWTAAS
jgi:TP901-1 family phage major tail protein